MKKQYTKPIINFNELTVSSISGGCALLSQHTEMVCPVTIPDWNMTFFSDGTCDLIPAEQVCYHIPTADSNVFSS